MVIAKFKKRAKRMILVAHFLFGGSRRSTKSITDSLIKKYETKTISQSTNDLHCGVNKLSSLK